MLQAKSLWQRYKVHGDLHAREQIILDYAYLAKFAVERLHVYPSASVDYDDLLGYAIVGLIDAVEKFDLSQGVKFETYALTRIRGAVLDALRSSDWTPRSVKSKGRQLKQVIADIED